jgi:two-component system response regulator YesN
MNTEKDLVENLLRFGKKEDIPMVCEKLLRFFRKRRMSTLLFVHSSIGFLKVIHEFCNDLNAEISEIKFPRSINDFFQFIGQYDEVQLTEYLEQTIGVIIDYRDRRKGRKHGSLISLAKRYIHEHYNDPSFSLVHTANHIGISVAYFSSLFLRETGQTFVEFLTAARMEGAKKLLVNPGKRITEIAFEVGYADPNYFSKLFKKSMGISPREFRCSQGIK